MKGKRHLTKKESTKYICNIMTAGFRFIYLAFGFRFAENLSAQHMGKFGANLSAGRMCRSQMSK